MTKAGDAPRILFLSPWEKLIGPNRYLVEMLRCLPPLCPGAIVVSHRDSDALEEYRSVGCRTAVWPEVAQVRSRLGLRYALSLLRRHSFGLMRIARRARCFAPDLIVSNTELLFLGSLLARRLKKPHVKVFHALTFSHRFRHRPSLQRIYVRTLAAGCDGVIAVSGTLHDALVASGVTAGKVRTVPNPMPTAQLEQLSRGEMPPDLAQRLRDRAVLLNVGRICPLKAQDQLVTALTAVRTAYPDMICVFAGAVGDSDGLEDTARYLKGLEAQIASHGLRESVLLLGEVDFVPALMRRATLYVHTSWMESFARVAAEALICRTAVVAYDAGAIKETTGAGSVLVAPGDPVALGRAIVDLLGDPERRQKLAQEGREHVVRNYAASVVALKFDQYVRRHLRCAV